MPATAGMGVMAPASPSSRASASSATTASSRTRTPTDSWVCNDTATSL
jgi:hypothetical protein